MIQEQIVKNLSLSISVADPESLSRIMIFIHPGSRIPDHRSQIPDPTPTKEVGEKNLLSHLFL